MKSSNRWLIIIGIVLLVLIASTAVLVLTMRNDTALLPENTPDGIVQRFFLALKHGDTATADSYFAPSVQNPKPPPNPGITLYSVSGWQVVIGKPVITGTNAMVSVTIDTFDSRRVFGNPVNTFTQVFTLTQQDGLWKITSPISLYPVYY